MSPPLTGTTSPPQFEEEEGKDVFFTNHLGNPNPFPCRNNNQHNSSMAK